MATSSLTYGEFKAELEKAGVTDDMPMNSICLIQPEKGKIEVKMPVVAFDEFIGLDVCDKVA